MIISHFGREAVLLLGPPYDRMTAIDLASPTQPRVGGWVMVWNLGSQSGIGASDPCRQQGGRHPPGRDPPRKRRPALGASRLAGNRALAPAGRPAVPQDPPAPRDRERHTPCSGKPCHQRHRVHGLARVLAGSGHSEHHSPHDRTQLHGPNDLGARQEPLHVAACTGEKIPNQPAAGPFALASTSAGCSGRPSTSRTPTPRCSILPVPWGIPMDSR